MVEIIECSFSDFVQTLSEPVIKKVIWDRYYKVKGTSERVPYQKIADAAGIGTICLLEQYALVRGNKEIAKQCEYIYFQLFQYVKNQVYEESIKKVLSDSHTEFTYSEYSKTVDFIKKNYGKWLGGLEFTRENKEFDYDEAYEKYKAETEPSLKDWNDIKHLATEQGLDIILDTEAMELHPVVEEFFDTQDSRMKQEYGNYDQWEELKLYEAYEYLKKVPCKSVDIEALGKEMEKKLDTIGRGKWQKKLDAFKEILADKPLLSGRIVLGDNEEKVKLAEKEFVNSGKFEYVIMINDSSRKLKCKEGMAITTKNLYYKSKLSGGEISVQDISHFEITGTMFGQSLAVYTVKGKKILVPCEIGKTEHLQYLNILNQLVKILRNQEK